MTATASRLCILGAALLFSTGGVAIKGCSLSGWQVGCFRSGVAAIAILFLLPGARGRWSSRTLQVALAYASTLILFVASTKLTTSASAIFLQSTGPLYILLLSPWLLHEPIRRRDLFFMAALAVGLSMFFIGSEQESSTAPDPTTGNLLAAACGVSWAFTVIGLRSAAKAGAAESSAAVAVLAGNVVAFLAGLPFALPVSAVEPTDLVVLGYLGVFQIALAYRLLTAGMRHITALETSLLLLIEPALNPIWVWVVHEETPSAFALAGGAIILVSTAWKSWRDTRVPA
jgi:drug/metabolite transporter (DMT)-like permease